MGDDIVEIFTENESLKKNRLWRWKMLQKSKAKPSKHIDDENRANIILSRMEKRMKRQ